MPYRTKLEPLFASYFGVDHPVVSKLYHPNQKPDILADVNKKLPLKEKAFDVAIMLQVLEYLEKPRVAFNEIARILKPNGVLILTSPFMYPIHDEPFDRNRFTQTQIKSFLKGAGFKIVKIKSQRSFWDFWFQSFLVFLFKALKRQLAKKTPASILVVTLLVFISLYLTPVANLLNLAIRSFTKNSEGDFPLNYLVVAKKA